jgi:tetratricopeptide (TPR) repeat protein
MISANELETLKKCCRQFISVNSFFSTSTDYWRAISFLNVSDDTDNLKAVLFEIDADPKMVATKPFADISSHSEYSDKSEVLFMLGSIFRLTSVSRNSESQVLVIRIVLCSENEHDLKEALMYMKQQTRTGETNLRTFGKILCKMGKFDLAKQYFSYLLKELSPKDPLIGILYEDLSELASQVGDYDKGIEWLQKANTFKNPNQLNDTIKNDERISALGKFIGKCPSSFKRDFARP